MYHTSAFNVRVASEPAWAAADGHVVGRRTNGFLTTSATVTARVYALAFDASLVCWAVTGSTTSVDTPLVLTDVFERTLRVGCAFGWWKDSLA